ncbi:MAG: aldo/keto reductase [Phenylobacterium sp.]|uniref:aldo/keto reductase n=1 Tax=Phenylobacterium sp. TaxID=1871053 RepID=UPI0027337553|nr:aldo/keto reductase [Phenylobacterium sp.]MDP3172892.1 aldo/keto reductase [Phenylobacterium sp.]
MSVQPSLRLNDGREMPQLGLGVWQTPADETAQAVKAALDAGYRSVDTAAIYRNEKGVGEGLRAASVARDDVAVTTKLWNEQQGFDSALKAFDDSLGRLGLDYVDLYLIHWPCPSRELYVDSWRALIRLKQEGRARSIGVSNFRAEHLQRIIDETGVTPAVNQIELHPRWQQQAMRDVDAGLGIITESWSPLGQGVLLADPALIAIAAKHGRTPAQVVIRWHLDLGLMVIPKSVTPSRIVENFQVFDFKLDAQDIAAISALDDANGRIGPDPAAFG